MLCNRVCLAGWHALAGKIPMLDDQNLGIFTVSNNSVFPDSIKYYRGGVEKNCESVRVSVEHPQGSLKCTTLTLKPMANGEQMSHSALAEFEFPLKRASLTVQKFMERADDLLPLEYIIVARSLEPGTAGTGARGGRAGASRQELNEHPNGCRDFTKVRKHLTKLCPHPHPHQLPNTHSHNTPYLPMTRGDGLFSILAEDPEQFDQARLRSFSERPLLHRSSSDATK